MNRPAVPSLQAMLQASIRELQEPGALLRSPSAAGLAVYREAYGARLVAALKDNFLVLHRAMGDEEFDALARAYVQAHPSAHASIRWFGDRLAEFMRGSYAERLPHPAMVDFARMDWALRAAFDGPDAEVLSAAHLQAVAPQDWPALVFHLHPSCGLLAQAWAIEPAWRALRAYEPEAGEAAPDLEAPQASAHDLLVWRRGLETHWRVLEPLEASLLKALAEAQSFEKICALAALSVGEESAAATVVTLLQRWLGDGLLASA